VNSARRIIAWTSDATPSPADLLNPALQHIREIDVREFQRLAKTFDFSAASKQGGVRVHDIGAEFAFRIARRLYEDARRDPAFGVTMRNVVIVALYAYALDVLAGSQVTLFRRMVEYLERRLRDETAMSRAMAATRTSRLGLEQLLAAANPAPKLGQPAADQTFMKLSQILEAIGASTAAVFHAAAVAPTDGDFFDLVDRSLRTRAEDDA
jgi:hypothetical protein